MSAVVEHAALGACATLRDATDAAHLRLHRLAPFAALVDGTVDRDGYRALLVALYGLHAPLDNAFRMRREAFAAYGIDVVARSRTVALVDDLHALGVDERALTAVPVATFDFADESTAALFGRLYVREGSTLGGRVLAGHLDRLLDGDTRGRAFLAGGSSTGADWRALRLAIERVADREPDGLDDLVAGAHASFDAFERWMT